MYIIEKLIKLFINLKKKPESIEILQNEDNPELEDIITCKHNFMPIDSTGKIFACSKCGYVVNETRLLKKEKKI